MICINCFHEKTKVTNSRSPAKKSQTWRRRHCLKCNREFTTYEKPDFSHIDVVYADATRKPYSKGAIVLSIAAAASHDPEIAKFHSYELASTAENRLLGHLEGARQLSSAVIAEEIYATLKRFDELTALQYAAQHRLITSVRRRGRPSTIATSGDGVVHD